MIPDYESQMDDISVIENYLSIDMKLYTNPNPLISLINKLQLIYNDKYHICNYANLTKDLYDEFVIYINNFKLCSLENNGNNNEKLIETTTSWLYVFFIIKNDIDIKKNFNIWTIDQKYEYLSALFCLEDFSNYSLSDGRVIENKKPALQAE
jgi:hypothetical protein